MQAQSGSHSGITVKGTQKSDRGIMWHTSQNKMHQGKESDVGLLLIQQMKDDIYREGLSLSGPPLVSLI